LHRGKTVTKEEIDDSIGTQQQRSENSSLKPKLTRKIYLGVSTSTFSKVITVWLSWLRFQFGFVVVSK